jgi:hypothetical protein
MPLSKAPAQYPFHYLCKVNNEVMNKVSLLGPVDNYSTHCTEAAR